LLLLILAGEYLAGVRASPAMNYLATESEVRRMPFEFMVPISILLPS